jgi:transposase
MASMSKKLWVGLDVGVHMTAICVLDASGVVICEAERPTSVDSIDQLLKPLRKGNIELIAMEAGSTSIYLTRGLNRLKYPVAIFECRQISTYLGLKQNKTDRNDARCIAEVARSGRGAISEVMTKTVECQRIRSMLATRQHLVRMRVGIEAAIGSQFNLYGGKMLRSRSGIILRRNVNLELARLRKEQKVDLRSDIEPIVSICESLRTYVEHLDRTFAQMANTIDICRRFMEIPGVGPIIALSFYSAICDPHRFEKCNDVGAYLGLVPRIRQSGGTVARFRISKMGNTMTRQHMCTAAMILLRSTTKPSQLKNWGLELRERRGAGRARSAVARKLSVIMLAMWKHGTAFDPFHSSVASSKQFSQIAA